MGQKTREIELEGEQKEDKGVSNGLKEEPLDTDLGSEEVNNTGESQQVKKVLPPAKKKKKNEVTVTLENRSTSREEVKRSTPLILFTLKVSLAS